MQLWLLLVRLCQKAGDKELVDCASLGFGEFFDIAISISCAVSFVRLSQLDGSVLAKMPHCEICPLAFTANLFVRKAAEWANIVNNPSYILEIQI
jgi:hypothetical protein